jgi:hypothetical protein
MLCICKERVLTSSTFSCLLALGEVDEAIKYYNQCIQSDGVDAKILAEAREGLGKTEVTI